MLVSPINKENKRRKHANRHKQFVTSLSAAALLMKSTHRNRFAYHIFIIIGFTGKLTGKLSDKLHQLKSLEKDKDEYQVVTLLDV